LVANETEILHFAKLHPRDSGASIRSLHFLKEQPMSMQPPFFGKRPADPIPARPITGASGGSPGSGANVEAKAMVAPVAAAAAPTADATLSGAPVKEGGSKLTVGPNIKLKGVEITDCDTLVVEGTVEATMDSRVMHITEIGAFKGSADIDYAEIHGEFTGNLTVREKLVIYSTGRVSGKIRYGKVVIQEGGQLMGDIQFGAANDAKAMVPPKVGLLTAA
jgi:cytoskeletal protein CcmA (bactofilin family)